MRYGPNEKFPLALATSNDTTPVVFHGYQFTRALSEQIKSAIAGLAKALAEIEKAKAK